MSEIEINHALDRPKQRGTEAIDFLGDLWPEGRHVTLTAITPDGPTTTKTFTDLERARRFIVRENDAGRNVYYTLNVTAPMDKKPKKIDVNAVAYLHVDADPDDDEKPEDFKRRMNKQIASFEYEPTFTIDSGNGLQFLWELEKLVQISNDDDIADIEARNHALALALGADPVTRNVDRILRVPGSINYPNERKREIGRRKCRAQYLERNGNAVYRLSDFPKHVEAPKEKRKATEQGGNTELPANLRTLLLTKNRGGYPSRHELVFAFVTSAIRAGLADEVIVDACINQDFSDGGIFAHIEANGGRKYAERQVKQAHAKVTSGKSVPTHTWDEPDISLLDDRRGKLPKFPLDVIRPKWLRDWLERAAHGTGTTVCHVAVPLLGISSSLIGASRKIQASASYSQPFTLWTMVVAPSGGGKTPGIDATRNPLSQLERDRETDNADLKRQHDEQVQRAEASHKRWQKEIKEAEERGDPTPPKPHDADRPGEYIAPRLYTSDVTIERMAQLLQARPQGMLLLSDELAGWFKNMSRYSGGSDAQFWLMAWDGKPYSNERKGSPPINLDHLLIGVMGGMQPDRLAEVLDGPADGMSARFLFVWPGKISYRPLSDTIEEVDDDIVGLLDKLSRLPVRKRPRVPLTEYARLEFEEVRKQVLSDARMLDGRERDSWAKIPAQVLRLAGTLAYLDWAVGDNKPEPQEIKDYYVIAAADLVFDYFWPHARAALRQIGLSQRHADARRVLHWIAGQKNLKEVSREEIRRDALSQSRDADETSEILHQLVKAGWLRNIEQSSNPKGGRPKLRWQVNSRIFNKSG